VYADYFGIPLRPDVSSSIQANTQNPNSVLSSNSFDFTPNFSLNPGSLSRNAFTGPKYANFDFGLVKNTRITERANLQFRAEFFNLFNNVNFREPYSRAGLVFADIGGIISAVAPQNCTANAVAGSIAGCAFADPFFGKVLQAFPARQIQFALKLEF
jgi:hypothetical protein